MAAESTQVIPAAEVRAQEQERRSLLATFAQRYGLEANKMMATLRATVLRPSNNGVEPSVEQVAAFLIVANHHDLNPFTKEIHGFVDKRGGIVPIVGVDGWAKKINEQPAFDGMDFAQDDEKCTCTMYRKDRSHPVVVTEYLNECKTTGQAWVTHPKRMLRHRAMVQAARICFSFAGVYEPEEGEQVLAAVNAEIDVTPGNEVLPGANKDGKVSPKKLREVVEGLLAAVEKQDGPALLAIYNDLTSEQQLYVWGELRSWERSAIKKLRETALAASCDVDLDKWSITTLSGCADSEALQNAWRAVQDAYAENDSTVPGDVETVYQDRKAELGAS